jgi:CheY-like chemotaxis protein
MKKKELLLVDDVKLFLQLGKTMVSREDFVVHTAMNGDEALQLARKNRVDVILLDLYMPGMDGDEVCREIRSDPLTENIPVIMVTTESDGEGRRRCFYAGCDDFMTKPVRADILNRAVDRQLAERERTHQRTDVVLPCLLDNGRDPVSTRIFTLSAGGAYVEMDPPPLPDTHHMLTFTLPEATERISVEALARWNRMQPGQRPSGSGFEFVDMGEKNYDRLNTWVEDLVDNPMFG